MDPSTENKFLEELITRNWIKRRQLLDAFKEKGRIKDQTGKDFLLGQILLRSGAITTPQFLEASKKVGNAILQCPRCDIIFSIPANESQRALCQCGSRLANPSHEENDWLRQTLLDSSLGTEVQTAAAGGPSVLAQVAHLEANQGQGSQSPFFSSGQGAQGHQHPQPNNPSPPFGTQQPPQSQVPAQPPANASASVTQPGNPNVLKAIEELGTQQNRPQPPANPSQAPAQTSPVSPSFPAPQAQSGTQSPSTSSFPVGGSPFGPPPSVPASAPTNTPANAPPNTPSNNWPASPNYPQAPGNVPGMNRQSPPQPFHSPFGPPPGHHQPGSNQAFQQHGQTQPGSFAGPQAGGMAAQNPMQHHPQMSPQISPQMPPPATPPMGNPLNPGRPLDQASLLDSISQSLDAGLSPFGPPPGFGDSDDADNPASTYANPNLNLPQAPQAHQQAPQNFGDPSGPGLAPTVYLPAQNPQAPVNPQSQTPINIPTPQGLPFAQNSPFGPPPGMPTGLPNPHPHAMSPEVMNQGHSPFGSPGAGVQGGQSYQPPAGTPTVSFPAPPGAIPGPEHTANTMSSGMIPSFQNQDLSGRPQSGGYQVMNPPMTPNNPQQDSGAMPTFSPGSLPNHPSPRPGSGGFPRPQGQQPGSGSRVAPMQDPLRRSPSGLRQVPPGNSGPVPQMPSAPMGGPPMMGRSPSQATPSGAMPVMPTNLGQTPGSGPHGQPGSGGFHRPQNTQPNQPGSGALPASTLNPHQSGRVPVMPMSPIGSPPPVAEPPVSMTSRQPMRAAPSLGGGNTDSIQTIQMAAVPPTAAQPPQNPNAPELAGEGYGFGRYQLHEELGRGASGTVFRSMHPDLNKPIAIKVLSDDLLTNDRAVKRFQREGKLMTAMNHENVVKVYDYGELDGRHFLVMDLVDGHSLDWHLKAGKMKVDRALRIIEAVCQGGQHAHDKGIVHRDLKPDNILITKDDEPLITDFGLAKEEEDGMGLTQEGTTIGTPYFMSPEQIQGHSDVDNRADIYSVGVIAYRILAGRLPFRARSAYELYNKVLKDEPKTPSQHNSQLNADFDTVLLKAMHKDRDQRYQKLSKLAQDLRCLRRKKKPINAGRKVRKKMRSWWNFKKS